MFRIEHNVETGEVKKIELSNAEIKELEKKYAAQKIKSEELEAEAESKAARRQEILEKLGLTNDEAQLLLG